MEGFVLTVMALVIFVGAMLIGFGAETASIKENCNIAHQFVLDGRAYQCNPLGDKD